MPSFSGNGGIWAQKAGDFEPKYFPGNQAGYDAAIVYVGTNGLVVVQPGVSVAYGTIPAGVTVHVFDNTGYAMLGPTSLMVPRFGPASTATTGGALRIVDGITFPLTVAGINAAMDEVAAAGGGTVMVPAAAGISVSTVSVKIPNRVRLMGLGALGSTATFVAAAGASASALVENKTQDGTQQYCFCEHISLDGNKAGGSTVVASLLYKKIYVGSAIKDVVIYNSPGNALKCDGGTANGLGELYLENVWLNGSNDHNLLITGQTDSIYALQLTCESVAAGKAQIMVDRAGAGTAPKGHLFMGVQFEGTAAYDGLVLNECNSVTVMNISDDGAGSANSLVKITGSVTGSDGAFAAGGHVIINARANLATIIDDQTAGVTVGNAQGRFVRWYSSPVASATKDKSQIIGLAVQRMGEDVPSATTIDLYDGSFIQVTGTTQIDNISNAARYKGKEVTVRTTGTVTIRHNGGGTGNIRCSGSANLSMTASDIVKFISDGTLWHQSSNVVVI